jgi:hypothetical protein
VAVPEIELRSHGLEQIGCPDERRGPAFRLDGGIVEQANDVLEPGLAIHPPDSQWAPPATTKLAGAHLSSIRMMPAGKRNDKVKSRIAYDGNYTFGRI